MSKAEIKEIIKAMAYGFTDEQVAEECEMTVEETFAFHKEHFGEITNKVGESNG